MKATLEFELPQEEPEHKYALAGLDALLVIDNIEREINLFFKYGSGCFMDTNPDSNTLEKVLGLIRDLKQQKGLPELY